MKIKIKWVCIALMCAILFGTLGYSYGSVITGAKCDKAWESKIESIKCNGDIFENSQTVSTNDVLFDVNKVNLSKLNFTPIEVNN